MHSKNVATPEAPRMQTVNYE